MSEAVREYLQANASDLAYDLGDTTAELRAAPGDRAAWARFGLGATKQIWAALPPELRTPAIQGLNEGIVIADEIATIGLDLAGTVLDAASISTDAIPIIGDAIGAALMVVEQVIAVVASTKSMHRTVSRSAKNWAQVRTLASQPNPAHWAAGLYRVENFEDYEHDRDARIDGVKWRRRASIIPSYRDPAVWGLGYAPEPVGDCVPGRELKRASSGYTWTDANPEEQTCQSFAGISALFWPFWSTNHRPTPLTVYTTAPESNPNNILAARQHALLAHPPTNLGVRGASLRRCRQRFTRYFRDQLDGLGGLVELQEGKVRGLRGAPLDVGISPARYAIDPRPIASHEFDGSVPFFWNRNGMVEAYAGADLGAVGVPAFGPPGSTPGLAYSAAQYNAVVGGVKALLVARAAMLTQPHAMAALVAGGPAAMRRIDPEARAAVRESARGAS